MRREGWEQFLENYIACAKTIPFEWGQHDCCLFVARYVDEVTGTEHTKEWHGRYNTEAGAGTLMALRGMSGPVAVADSCLVRKSVLHAGRGDIVSFDGSSIGICAGRYSYFFVEGKGLCPLPTLKCRDAWEV